VGKVEYAHGGTLFLDEIGEMGPALQAKLLRVIEEKTFTRVGSARPVRVDVRVICATHRDLAAMVREGAFREDLYYRLGAFPIRIPPLRERPEDIPLLAEHFLGLFRKETGRPELALSEEALRALQEYRWPGNVRELMNRLERAAILAPPDGVVGPGLLALETAPPGGSPPPAPGSAADPERWLREEERWRARELLRLCGGDRRRAARLLDWPPSRLEAVLKGEDPKL
jgi:transcriptional regulator with GAF, ATPase, and Fis domain